MTTFHAPIELTDSELDAVAGGAQVGLVNVDVDVRNVTITDTIDLTNVLNDNQVVVGVLSAQKVLKR